jgi:hypothetical protein
MHIMPWSWRQLYLHLKLAGFADVTLHLHRGRAHESFREVSRAADEVLLHAKRA